MFKVSYYSYKVELKEVEEVRRSYRTEKEANPSKSFGDDDSDDEKSPIKKDFVTKIGDLKEISKKMIRKGSPTEDCK